MARGVAGYGRYDDDRKTVGCPWAKSDMTPCLARDGHLALGGEPAVYCVGCGNTVLYLIYDLAADYRPARSYPETTAGMLGPVTAAKLFRRLVWEATAPLAGEEAVDDNPG